MRLARGSLVGAPSNRVRSQPHQNRWPPCAKLMWPPCAKLESPCVKPEWPCAKLKRTPHEGGDPDLKLRGALPPGGFRLWETVRLSDTVRLRKAVPLGEMIRLGGGRGEGRPPPPPGGRPPAGDRPRGRGGGRCGGGGGAASPPPPPPTRGEDAVGRVTATSPSSGRRRLPSHSRR